MNRKLIFIMIFSLGLIMLAACEPKQQSTESLATLRPVSLSTTVIIFTPTHTLMPTPTWTATPSFTPTIVLTPISTLPTLQREGDWIVTTDEEVRDVEIVLNGNLSIEPGGSLTLINVRLLFKQPPDRKISLKVKKGGDLIISRSTIAPSQNDTRFIFSIQDAHFELKQSFLEGMDGGLQIDQTDGVVIEGNSINHEANGIRLMNSNNALITDNTITAIGADNLSEAIRLINSNNNLITHNHLIKQYVAVSVESSSNNYIAYNDLTLTNNTGGIAITYGSGNNTVAYNDISAYKGYNHV